VILICTTSRRRAWGLVVRRILEAATRTLPLLAVLFLRSGWGARRLHWAAPVTPEDVPLPPARAYLIRALLPRAPLIYFGAGSAARTSSIKWSPRARHPSRSEPRRALFACFAAPGLALYGPHRHLRGHRLGDVARAALVLDHLPGRLGGPGALRLRLRHRRRRLPPPARAFARLVTPANLNDLGNLMLAFVMLWAYMAFSQFLLMWSGNIREEVPWYLAREHGGWRRWRSGSSPCTSPSPLHAPPLAAREARPRLIGAVAGRDPPHAAVDLLWLLVPGFHRRLRAPLARPGGADRLRAASGSGLLFEAPRPAARAAERPRGGEALAHAH